MKRSYLSFLTLLLLFVLAACTATSQPDNLAVDPSPTPGPDVPVSSNDPTPLPDTNVDEPPAELTYGQATVESIQIMILESFPVQVQVLAQGYLSNGCTEISDIQTDQDGNTYQVTITTQSPVDVACTEALVPFEETVSLDVLGLPAGTYTVNVNGVTDTFTLAVDNEMPSEEPGVEAEETAAFDLPEACRPGQAGHYPYVNYETGYCLQVPQEFSIGDVFPHADSNVQSILGIYGPPMDQSMEPLRAGLSIVLEGPAEGRSLDELADEWLAPYEGSDIEVTREQTTFAGLPALILDGMPGRTTNRQLVVIHEDQIYTVTVFPTGDDFPQLAEQVESIWRSTVDTFSFLTPEQVAQFEGCPAEAAPYANVTHGYCLRYPTHFSLMEQMGDGSTMLSGPSLDQSVEPVRALLTISVPDTADGRSLEEIVTGVIAEYEGFDISRAESSVAGQPAITLDGIPGRGTGRAIYTVQNDTVYVFTLWPVDEQFPQAEPDIQELWQAVSESFTSLD